MRLALCGSMPTELLDLDRSYNCKEKYSPLESVINLIFNWYGVKMVNDIGIYFYYHWLKGNIYMNIIFFLENVLNIYYCTIDKLDIIILLCSKIWK